jgi:hypothetical protein
VSECMAALAAEIAQYPKPTITFDEAYARRQESLKILDEHRIEKAKKRLASFRGLSLSEIQENKLADEKIANSYFNDDDLPGFPQINHPVLGEWMDIAGELMYSRVPFHFGNLLPILSIGIGLKACVKLGLKNLYCNLYVMIAGVTTISGKSWSCENAVDQFAPAVIGPDLETDADGKVNIEGATGTIKITKSISNASFLQDICKDPNVFWYYDESREFFIEAEQWNQPILKTLCTAYDGGELSRKLSKRNKGDDTNISVCKKPFVSCLFNMTLAELQATCTGGMWKSGLTPRWMWFIENGGEMKKNRSATEKEEMRIKELYYKIHATANQLRNLEDDSIIFKVNDEIENWKIETSKKYPESEFHQTAVGRGFIHIYKLAIILTLYDPKFRTCLLPPDKTKYPMDLPDEWVKAAIKIENQYLFPRMVKVLKMSEIENKNNKQLFVIEKLKELKGSATPSELLRKTRMGQKELKEAMATLVLSGEVIEVSKHLPKEEDTEEKNTPKKPGPVAIVYCLNPKFL